MNSASMRLWTFATVIVMIVVVALGWFLGAAPRLSEAARFESERVAVQGQNDIARALIAQLEQDSERVGELRDQLAVLRAAFPTQVEYDLAVEEFITSLVTQGLTLQNLSITEPSPSSAQVLASDEVAPEPEIDGAGVLPSGSLLLVSTSVTVEGPLSATLAFIDALQRSPRFAVIPTVAYSADGAEGLGGTTITVNIYVISGEDLVDAEATLTEPEPTPTPTPTAPTATPTPGAPTPSSTPTP